MDSEDDKGAGVSVEGVAWKCFTLHLSTHGWQAGGPTMETHWPPLPFAAKEEQMGTTCGRRWGW